MNIKSPFAVAVVFCSLSAANIRATVVAPIGLGAGSQYQLIFATAETTFATVGAISYYDAFVTSAAINGAPAGLPSASWNAVGSAATDPPASTHAPWLGVPVYNTRGQLVSTVGGIYAGGLTNAVGFDESGNPVTDAVWTGSDAFGNATASPLGGPGFLTFVEIGNSTQTNGTWLDLGGGDPAGVQSFPIYALSGILVVPTPEPGSLALMAFGVAALVAVRLRKRVR